MSEIHQSCMNEASVKVVEPIVGFETDGFLEFSKGVVDLVQHHHAVASVGKILGVFVVKTDSSAEVVHCLLVMSGSHKSIASVGMVLCMGGATVTGWGRLEMCDSLAKVFDGEFCIQFVFVLVISF